jgi:hypothetical protein
MYGRRELAAYAPDADADGAEEGALGGEESVEGLGSRGKEQNLKKQNARLAVEVRALKSQVAALGASSGGGEGGQGVHRTEVHRTEELQAALAELKISREMLMKSEEDRTELQKQVAELHAVAGVRAATGGYASPKPQTLYPKPYTIP